MLTPLDIHNKEFKKSLRGYEMDDVDGFLDQVIKDFENLYKENLELKEQLEKQQDTVFQYKEMETTLQNTMVLAQKMADEAKHNANKEAELIIREAKHKADQVVEKAQEEVLEVSKRIENLYTFEKQLMLKLSNYLKTQLDFIDNWHGEFKQQDEGIKYSNQEKEKEKIDDIVECDGDQGRCSIQG